MAIANVAFIGSDAWNAELYGSLSISSRLKSAIANGTAQFKIAAFFWKTNRALDSFLEKIDTAERNAESGKTKASEPLNLERVEKTVNSLIDLCEVLNNIHQLCVRHRLNNASRLAGGLSRLRKNADRIEEIAHWLNDVTHPDFKDKFAAGEKEFKNGETVPASEVWR
jgi:hypothetical protein